MTPCVDNARSTDVSGMAAAGAVDTQSCCPVRLQSCPGSGPLTQRPGAGGHFLSGSDCVASGWQLPWLQPRQKPQYSSSCVWVMRTWENKLITTGQFVSQKVFPKLRPLGGKVKTKACLAWKELELPLSIAEKELRSVPFEEYLARSQLTHCWDPGCCIRLF